MGRIGDAWRALRGAKASATQRGGVMLGGGQAIRMRESYEGLSREAFKGNVVARRCIGGIAGAAAKVDLLVFRGSAEAPESPLAKLLQRPNPWQSGAAFIESVVAYYQLAGDSFIESVGPSDLAPPTELYALRPDRVEVNLGESGVPVAYTYRLSGRPTIFPVDALDGSSPILHWHTFNPMDEWRGLSKIASAALSVDQHNAAGEWNLRLLQNSARPSGILNVKGETTTEQRKDLRADIEEKAAGAANAGRPMIGYGDITWQAMGFTPAEMDWLEGRNTSARDICAAFDFPPMLLGIPGDNTYSNFQEARAALYEDAVLQCLDSLLDGLNHAVAMRYGEDWRIAYDPDSIEALAVRRAAKWAAVDGVTFLSINEKREECGFEKVEGGDDILVPSTLLPLGFDPGDAQDDTEPETDPKKKPAKEPAQDDE